MSYQIVKVYPNGNTARCQSGETEQEMNDMLLHMFKSYTEAGDNIVSYETGRMVMADGEIYEVRGV